MASDWSRQLLLAGLLATGGTKCVYIRTGFFTRAYLINVRSATAATAFRFPSDVSLPVEQIAVTLPPTAQRFPYGLTVEPWVTP